MRQGRHPAGASQGRRLAAVPPAGSPRMNLAAVPQRRNQVAASRGRRPAVMFPGTRPPAALQGSDLAGWCRGTDPAAVRLGTVPPGLSPGRIPIAVCLGRCPAGSPRRSRPAAARMRSCPACNQAPADLNPRSPGRTGPAPGTRQAVPGIRGPAIHEALPVLGPGAGLKAAAAPAESGCRSWRAAAAGFGGCLTLARQNRIRQALDQRTHRSSPAAGCRSRLAAARRSSLPAARRNLVAAGRRSSSTVRRRSRLAAARRRSSAAAARRSRPAVARQTSLAAALRSSVAIVRRSRRAVRRSRCRWCRSRRSRCRWAGSRPADRHLPGNGRQESDRRRNRRPRHGRLSAGRGSSRRAGSRCPGSLLAHDRLARGRRRVAVPLIPVAVPVTGTSRGAGAAAGGLCALVLPPARSEPGTLFLVHGALVSAAAGTAARYPVSASSRRFAGTAGRRLPGCGARSVGVAVVGPVGLCRVRGLPARRRTGGPRGWQRRTWPSRGQRAARGGGTGGLRRGPVSCGRI